MRLPVLLIFAASTFGQETVHLNLKQAVETALRQNPAVTAARQALDEADARIKEARADYFPQLGFSGIAKAGLSGATNALGLVGLPNSPFYRNFADSLNIYQSALDFGRREHRVAFERRRREVAEAQLHETEAFVIRKTERAYYDLLRAQRLQEVAADVVRSRESVMRQAQAFYEGQIRSRVDVELARAGLARARLELLKVENNVRTSIAELGRALGGSQDARYELELPDLALPQPEPLPSLIEEAYRTRPELLAAQAELRVADEALEFARSQKRPLLAFAFSGGYARFRDVLAQQLLSGGTGLILPLFTGGRLQGQIDEARARLQIAESRQEDVRQQVALEVRKAYVKLQNALESIPMLRQQAEASRQALRLASERYRERLGTLVELNEVQANLADAAAGEATGLYDAKVAESELQFSIGRR
jgi:outer membrane protein